VQRQLPAQRSPAPDGTEKRLSTDGTTGAAVRAERSALFYTVSIARNLRFVKSFFQFFSLFLPAFGATFLSIGKSYKNNDHRDSKILRHMLFHKYFCGNSSQLNIYKNARMQYNVLC